MTSEMPAAFTQFSSHLNPPRPPRPPRLVAVHEQERRAHFRRVFIAPGHLAQFLTLIIPSQNSLIAYYLLGTGDGHNKEKKQNSWFRGT